MRWMESVCGMVIGCGLLVGAGLAGVGVSALVDGQALAPAEVVETNVWTDDEGRVWEDEWRWRGEPLDDPCDPAPWPESPGYQLDVRTVDRDDYLGCLWVYPGDKYQQRLTITAEGPLGRFDVATGGGNHRKPHVTYPIVGVTLGGPWVKSLSDEEQARFTFTTVIESSGDIFEPNAIDISHLGWYVYPGDTITVHFEPQEATCMGYNAFMCENYAGGEMWQDGAIWGCQGDPPGDIMVWAWRLDIPYLDVD